ncbi:organic cation transporter protein-like isoform X2 [Glandiceps talaboti]
MATKKTGEKLHYDDVLTHTLGELGRHQMFCFALLSLTAIPAGIQSFAIVFTLAETDSWCKVPDDITTQVCVSNFTASNTSCVDQVKNLTIPKEESGDVCGSDWQYSKCYRYSNISYGEGYSLQRYGDDTMYCDRGWEYDRSKYKSTLSQEFDLVCDSYYLSALLTSIAYSGYLVGSIASGMVLDKIGRLRGLVLSLILFQVFGISAAFAPSYPVYAVFHFCISVVGYCTYLGGFILVLELVGPSKRTMVGMVVPMFYGVGYMLLSLFAYFFREWWKLQLAIIIPNALLLVYWFVIPESPRWLLSMGKEKEAKKIIKKIAKINKVTLPKDIFDDSWKPCLDDDSLGEYKQEPEPMDDEKQYGVLDLFRFPNMRKKTLTLAFNWLANNVVYFGLSLSTSSLGGSDFINAFLSAAVEVPAYGIAIFLLESPKLGRRRSLFITMLLSGFGCISAAFVPQCSDLVWLRVTFAMIGKFGISSSFGIAYVYGAELFPTPVRSVGVGLCSMLGYIGGILAPQLLLLSSIWQPLPPIILGIMAILAGVASLLLPETRGKKLPETMEEGERFGKKGKPQRNDKWYPGFGQIRQIQVNSDVDKSKLTNETFI